MNHSKVEKSILFPSLILVVAVTVLLVIFRESAGPVLEGMLSGITNRLDWAFEFLTIGLFMILLWLMLGRYGG